MSETHPYDPITDEMRNALVQRIHEELDRERQDIHYYFGSSLFLNGTTIYLDPKMFYAIKTLDFRTAGFLFDHLGETFEGVPVVQVNKPDYFRIA